MSIQDIALLLGLILLVFLAFLLINIIFRKQIRDCAIRMTLREGGYVLKPEEKLKQSNEE